MIIYGEMIGFRRLGETEIPQEPEAWSEYAQYTSSATFTVPEDGWYRFIFVGKGGNGGDGTARPERNSYNLKFPATGGGGGAGGLAVHQAYLKKGAAVPLVISALETTAEFTIDGAAVTVTAKCGGNGSSATGSTYSYSQPGSGGAGGTASGGNIANLTGGNGGSGSSRKVITAEGFNGGTYWGPEGGAGGAVNTTGGYTQYTGYHGRGGDGGGQYYAQCWTVDDDDGGSDFTADFYESGSGGSADSGVSGFVVVLSGASNA